MWLNLQKKLIEQIVITRGENGACAIKDKQMIECKAKKTFKHNLILLVQVIYLLRVFIMVI